MKIMNTLIFYPISDSGEIELTCPESSSTFVQVCEIPAVPRVAPVEQNSYPIRFRTGGDTAMAKPHQTDRNPIG